MINKKDLIKTAQERIASLVEENATLRKEAASARAECKDALKKLAHIERGIKVDKILDMLIDEKNYFPESQRQEKRAYLMDEANDLDAFIKMAEDLSPREPGMYYEAGTGTGTGSRDESFYDNLIDRLHSGLYGGRQ